MRPNERPNDTWTIEQLTEYCRQSVGRLAIEAWYLGKAFALVRQQLISTKGAFDKWKRSAGWSDSIVSRYVRLHEKTKLADIKKMNVTDACRAAGIPISGGSTTYKGSANADRETVPSWAAAHHAEHGPEYPANAAEIASELRDFVQRLGPACEHAKLGERIASLLIIVQSLLADIEKN